MTRKMVGALILLIVSLRGASLVAGSRAEDEKKQASAVPSASKPDGDYVGSEVCATCHAEQQKSFVHTIMGNAMAHPKSAAGCARLRILPWAGQGPRGRGRRQGHHPGPLHQGFA